MSVATPSLGALRERSTALEPRSIWAAAAVVAAAWGLIALARLGGLALDAPRAATRLTLRGVWGWLALSVAIWGIAGRLARGAARGGAGVRSLELTLAMTGLAHAPIIAVAGVLLIAAGLLQLLGPGLIVASIALAVVVPLALLTGVQHIFGLSVGRAAATIALPYAGWLAVVVRPLLDQVAHLL